MSGIVVDGFGAAIRASATYLLAQMDPEQVGSKAIASVLYVKHPPMALARVHALACTCMQARPLYYGAETQQRLLHLQLCTHNLWSQIARSGCGPLLEIQLELVAPDVVWSPELGESGGESAHHAHAPTIWRHPPAYLLVLPAAAASLPGVCLPAQHSHPTLIQLHIQTHAQASPPACATS